MKTVFDHVLKASLFVVLIATVTFVFPGGELMAGEIDIKVNSPRGLQQKIAARFEHEGEVIVDDAGQRASQEKLQMRTIADLVFHQRLTGSVKDLQAIRYYDSSHGNFNIAKGKTDATLAKSNRMIVARLKSKPGQRIQMASIQDLLNQSELNLIKNPADPLSYGGLLNKNSVAQGEKWSVDKNALADFLAVDRILFTDAKMMLKKATPTAARIYLLGQVDATVDDAGTSMKVSAIFDIDRARQQVTSVRLSIDENRQPGQVAPGFQGKSRVNVQLNPDRSCAHLTTANLKKLTNARRIKQRLQWQSEKGQFALEYDPRWKMIVSEGEAAILRYVDDGDLLAQCNVLQLPARPASKPLTLAEYRGEIEKIIRADKSAKLVDAVTVKSATGNKTYRVEVDGVEDEIPVKWIYYHVAAKDGRRLTFIFTLEQEIANIFKPSDQRMVNGLSFQLASSASAKVANRSGGAKRQSGPSTRRK